MQENVNMSINKVKGTTCQCVENMTFGLWPKVHLEKENCMSEK